MSVHCESACCGIPRRPVWSELLLVQFEQVPPTGVPFAAVPVHALEGELPSTIGASSVPSVRSAQSSAILVPSSRVKRALPWTKRAAGLVEESLTHALKVPVRPCPIALFWQIVSAATAAIVCSAPSSAREFAVARLVRNDPSSPTTAARMFVPNLEVFRAQPYVQQNHTEAEIQRLKSDILAVMERGYVSASVTFWRWVSGSICSSASRPMKSWSNFTCRP